MKKFSLLFFIFLSVISCASSSDMKSSDMKSSDMKSSDMKSSDMKSSDMMSMETLAQKQDRVKKYMAMSSVKIVDVRPSSYTDKYNASTIRHPLPTADYSAAGLKAVLGMDMNVPIVVYCGTAENADMGAQKIRAAGYTMVVDAGSFADFKALMGMK